MRVMIRGALLLTFLVLNACTMFQPSVSEQFDRSVKAYNKMLRWHEIENAGVTYVDQDLQDTFLKQAGVLKQRGLSVTDFRILTSKFIQENNTGDVIAEFDYFILPSSRVKTVSYRQDWAYRDEFKSWKLKTGLPAFE